MATWASLTPTQQADIQGLVAPLRSFVAELARLGDHGQAISASWNGGISTLVNSLGSTEIIPVGPSGLAGAQGLSPADVVNMVGYLIDLSNPANNTAGGGYNTAFHRALYVKACGINASLSQ
jgi:hypothetical protein